MAKQSFLFLLEAFELYNSHVLYCSVQVFPLKMQTKSSYVLYSHSSSVLYSEHFFGLCLHSEFI